MRALAGLVKPAHLVGLAILAAAWGLRLWDPEPLQLARLATFDQYQKLKPRPPQPTPLTVALVDIDESSLARLGQWPWPRTVLAHLIERLAEYQVLAIGFDIIFPEYDRLSPARLADQVEGLEAETAARLRALPATETRLARAMAALPVALGEGAVVEGEGADEAPAREGLGRKATFAEVGPDPRPALITFAGLTRNVPELEAAATGLGIVTMAPEPDQVVRRLPLAVGIGDEIYPVLGLELLRVATGQPTILLKSDSRLEKRVVAVQGLPPIETDSRFRVWPYYRERPRDLYVSAADVLAGAVPAERLRGALVVVGTSAAGLHDLRRTPIAAGAPGFEIHAQFLETVLTQSFLRRPPWLEMVEGTALVGIGLLMIALVPMLGATLSLVLGTVVVGAMFGASWYGFVTHRVLADPLYPSLAGLLLYLTLTYLNYRREEAERRRIRNAFGRFLAPAMVERLAADPSRLRLGGEMKELTLLFADIRGFTTIAEDYDPEGLTRLINRFLTPMTGVILDSGGTIDKYIGDCVMAFWNAPLDDPDHACHGCKSALAMLAACAELNREIDSESGGARHPIRVGIGINTDLMCVGNMGSEQRFDYSVLGDGVNLASRLEGQTKAYGVDIVIGERTRGKAPAMAAVELDLIRVKGRARPERIYTLLGQPALAESAAFRAFTERQAAMLAAYRAQAWDDCLRLIETCEDLARDWPLAVYYDLLRGRVRGFRTEPPGDDWDGVYAAATK